MKNQPPLAGFLIATLLVSIVGLGVYFGGVWTQPAGPAKVVDDQLSYLDIDCDVPPGQSRVDFLNEVRYLGLPEKLRLGDQGSVRQIRQAFGDHQKVSEVEAVIITELAGKTRLQVKLKFK
jgi:hypothetical protein